jgi:hypothetical protein
MNSPKDPFTGNDMTDLIVPAALRIWLLFLLVFTLLGYPVVFSILFGALGGFAGGMISAWWSLKGGDFSAFGSSFGLDPTTNDAKPKPSFQLPPALNKLPQWRSGQEKRYLQRRRRR